MSFVFVGQVDVRSCHASRLQAAASRSTVSSQIYFLLPIFICWQCFWLKPERVPNSFCVRPCFADYDLLIHPPQQANSYYGWIRHYCLSKYLCFINHSLSIFSTCFVNERSLSLAATFTSPEIWGDKQIVVRCFSLSSCFIVNHYGVINHFDNEAF